MDIIIPYYSEDNGGHDLAYTLEQAYASLKEKGAVAWGRRAMQAFPRLSMELTIKKGLNVVVCENGKKDVKFRLKVTELWQKTGKYDRAQIVKYLPSAWSVDIKEHSIFFKVVDIEIYKACKKLKDFIDIEGHPVSSVKKGRTDYALIKDDSFPTIKYDPVLAKSDTKVKKEAAKKAAKRRMKKEKVEASKLDEKACENAGKSEERQEPSPKIEPLTSMQPMPAEPTPHEAKSEPKFAEGETHDTPNLAANADAHEADVEKSKVKIELKDDVNKNEKKEEKDINSV